MLTSHKSDRSSQRQPWFLRKRTFVIGALAFMFLLLALTAQQALSHHLISSPAQLAYAVDSGQPINVPRQLSTQPPEQQELLDCAHAPSSQHCNRQDPIAQGCVADARTILSVPIIHGKVTIGRLDLRFSPACKSYWGRTFSYIDGVAETDMRSPFTENIVGPFRGGVTETYTDMAFGSVPTLVGIVHSTTFGSTMSGLP